MISQGYDTATLAAELGVCRGSIQQWVNGRSRPRSESLKLITDFFGIEINVMVDQDLNIKIPTAMTGRKIRHIRKQKHLTLDQLCEGTMLLKCSMSRIENGIQVIKDMELLKEIAEALEVTTEELLN